MTAILLPKCDTSASCARCLGKENINIICGTHTALIVTGLLTHLVGRIQQNFGSSKEEHKFASI
jgi:hypothetical protein